MSDNLKGNVRRTSMAAEDAAARRAELGIQPAETVTQDAAQPEPEGARRRRPRNRRPFGSREQKLAYPNRPGYHRHWFNDEPGRVDRAKAAGYEHVLDDDGKPVSTVVGTARGGGPLIGYLMETPLEWFMEDREENDAMVHDLMGQIKQGNYQKPTGRDGDLRYAGSTRGEISIREGERR